MYVESIKPGTIFAMKDGTKAIKTSLRLERFEDEQNPDSYQALFLCVSFGTMLRHSKKLYLAPETEVQVVLP